MLNRTFAEELSRTSDYTVWHEGEEDCLLGLV